MEFGCPHRRGMPEGPDKCGFDGEGQICGYELGGIFHCEEFGEILEERKKELEIDYHLTYEVKTSDWKFPIKK